MVWHADKIVETWEVRPWGRFFQAIHNQPGTVAIHDLAEGATYASDPGTGSHFYYLASGSAVLTDGNGRESMLRPTYGRLVAGKHHWTANEESRLVHFIQGTGEITNAKIIEVAGGGVLSPQNHKYRDEVHIPIEGEGEYLLADIEGITIKNIELIAVNAASEPLLIPAGKVHTFRSESGLRVAEYTAAAKANEGEEHFFEDDIRRFSPTGADLYGRACEVVELQTPPKGTERFFPAYR